MSLTDQQKDYILQSIFNAFDGDPHLWAEHLAISRVNTQRMRLQNDLARLDAEHQTAVDSYQAARTEILNQIAALDLSPGP